MPFAHGLQISPSAGTSALTPDQQRFNLLIRQIGQSRQTLAAWRESIALYAQNHARVIRPLAQAQREHRREWVFALDEVLARPGWSKTEAAALRELVCEAAAELLQQAEAEDDDAALKALYNRHNDIDFDTAQQAARNSLQDMLDAASGRSSDPAGHLADDDELRHYMQQQAAKAAARAAERAAAGAADADGSAEPDGTDDDPARPGNDNRSRQSRRKAAAQQRREAEAQLATQSVREVYRKLASALHPDREADPGQRETKTALMQKANQAYAANDLLGLLELQLQIEQVDAHSIAQANAQRVKHYNQVLTGQLAVLMGELQDIETGLRRDFCIAPDQGLTPHTLPGLIDNDAKHLRALAAQHPKNLRMLANKAEVRRWIKRERARLQQGMDDEFF